MKINDVLVTNHIHNSNYNHSETLLPIINNIIKLNKIKINDISTFIVANGPGSFTGIRIAIATVYGLSITQKSKIVGISTLHAMAMQNFNIYHNYYFISILKANNKKVFNAVFFHKKDNSFEKIYDDRVIDFEDIINEFCNKPCIILGYSYELSYQELKIYFKNFYFFNLDYISNAYNLINIFEKNINIKKNKNLITASYLMNFIPFK